MGRPMEAAIDAALSTNYSVLGRRIAFKPASRPDNQDEELRRKYKPLNTLAPVAVTNGVKKNRYAGEAAAAAALDAGADENAPPRPKKILFAADRVAELMAWRRAGRAGAGLYNYGNTCFLNAVLQALTHTPPLANYLLSKEHSRQCRMDTSNCAMCEMEQHVQAALTSTRAIKPQRIVTKLKVWGKHFRKGRQEDAHEFLRYFTDAMQKACLAGHDAGLDHATKATTFVHQVFGGYLRSQVKCRECGYESNTYDANLDLSLDIKHARSVARALAEFTKPETLDKANMYQCARCKRKVVAHKRFTIHTPPAVLTVHLKRFDFTYRHGQKITRHVEFDEALDLAPYMSDAPEAGVGVGAGPSVSVSAVRYRLAAVVVHAGHTVHSGHYYAYVRAPGGTWWCCDDDDVRTAGLSTVLRQQAYMLVYTRDMPAPAPAPGPAPAQAPAPVEKAAPVAEGVPEAEAETLSPAREPRIVHVSAAENRRRRLVNCVARMGAWWEVAMDAEPDAVYRVEISPCKRKAEDDDDGEGEEEEEEEKPAALQGAAPKQAAAGVRVQHWDATLGKDDLVKRTRGSEHEPQAQIQAQAQAQAKAKWDGRAGGGAADRVDVIGRLRDNKFSGFAGISTWDGDASLVETTDLGERRELFRYSYTKDDMAIDTGRTKKVKARPGSEPATPAHAHAHGPRGNVFQAALDRKKAAGPRPAAGADDFEE